MAQITWRNVDAPSFSGSLDGLRVAGGMLNNATSALSDGLKSFGEAQQQRAGAAVLNNALQYTDPAAYQAALADGSLMNGVDRSQVSTAVLGALADRSGQLLDNAGNQQKQSIIGYNFDRTQQQDQNSDAARNAIGQIYSAQQAGNSVLANKLIADNAGVLGNLTAEQQANLYKTGGDLASTRLQNIGRNIDNQGSALTLTQREQQYQRSEKANSLIQDMLSRTFSPADRTAYISNYALSPNADPGVTALLRQAGGVGGIGGGTGMGGGSTTGLLTGGGQLPTNFRTIGDVVDNKSALLALNPKGTALGNYQITADTYADFAPKVFGDNWRNVDVRDPDAQDAIGKAIWDSAKGSGSAIKARWDSLTPAQAEALVGKPWEEVRTLIAQKESGANPNDLTTILRNNNTKNTVAQTMLDARMAQNNVGLPSNIQQSLNDKSTPAEVADRLTKGDLKGTDNGWVLGTVQDIMKKTGYNAAQAEAIIKNNIAQSDAGTLGQVFRTVGHPIDWFANRRRDVNLGNGRRLNTEGMDSDIESLRTGSVFANTLDNQNTQVQGQAFKTAQDNANAAATQLQQLKIAAKSNPGLLPLIPKYTQQAQMFQQTLDDIGRQTGQNPGYIPLNFDPVGNVQKAAEDRRAATVKKEQDDAQARSRKRIEENNRMLQQMQQRPGG